MVVGADLMGVRLRVVARVEFFTKPGENLAADGVFPGFQPGLRGFGGLAPL